MNKMRKKRDYNGNSLKWKVIILIGGVILLVGMVALQWHGREKEKAEYEESMKQKEKDEIQAGEEGKEQEKESGALIEDADQNTADGMEEPKADVHITNLNEYATEVMGENTYLLEERLGEWMKEKQLEAESGIIFHTMVPQSDPQSINFYIRLEDARSSLVMLAYHPRENVVTASICKYTEQEIKEEVWENNGPAQRDVPAEEDTENLNEQERADDTEGEN